MVIRNKRYFQIPKNCKVINGDNWYIVFGAQGVLDSCCLSGDKLAEIEFNSVMERTPTSQQTLEVDIPNEKAKK